MPELKPHVYIFKEEGDSPNHAQYSVIIKNQNFFLIQPSDPKPRQSNNKYFLEMSISAIRNATVNPLHLKGIEDIHKVPFEKSLIVDTKTFQNGGTVKMSTKEANLDGFPQLFEYLPHLYLFGFDKTVRKKYTMSVMVLVRGYQGHKIDHVPQNLGGGSSVNLVTTITIDSSNIGASGWEQISVPIEFPSGRDGDDHWEIKINDVSGLRGKGKVTYGDADEQPFG